MQAISVGELKPNFSEVFKKLQTGEDIANLYGKRKKIVAKLVPEIPQKNPEGRLVSGIKKGA